MTTKYEDLLAPYAEWLKAKSDKRKTVAEAMLISEAKHVAKVRNAQGEPLGGWKNKLPLEHNTVTGWYFRALRTGDATFLRARAAAGCKDSAKVLQCECVFADADECKSMTADELIEYADIESNFGAALS